MWRVFDTLSSRGFAIPTLRSRWSLSMGLLRFSLFEAAKNQSFIKLEPFVCSTRYRVAPWGFLFAPSPINERVAKF